jgi:hypothetical protein
MEFLNNLNLNDNQLLNALLQILGVDPTGGNLKEAKIWYNSTGKVIKFYDGTSVRTVSTDDVVSTAVQTEIDSAVEGRNWGVACRVASTTNGTLSTAFANGQTVDGVALVTGDRILLKDQSTDTENGTYTVNASGAPTRAGTNVELANHAYMIEEGSTNADTSWVCTNDSITYGTTSISFNQNGSGTVPDASTTVKGKVELATAAETEAKTDTTRAIPPSGLVRFGLMYSADFLIAAWVGASAPYTITVANSTHNCGDSKKLMVQTFEDGTPNQMCLCDTTVSDTGEVVIKTNEKFDGHYVIVGIG